MADPYNIHPSHRIRNTDSPLFGIICNQCHHTDLNPDTLRHLREPCTYVEKTTALLPVTPRWIQYLRLAEGFRYGYAHMSAAAPLEPQSYPDMATVRDFLISEVECEPIIAERIALYVTRPSDMYFVSL
jgi:hypothetical protein